MNIKNLVKVAKVVAAVAMVGVVSGCATAPVGTLVKGEVVRVESWEKAHEVKIWNVTGLDQLYGDHMPAGASVMEFRTKNDVFGGGGWNHRLALVPPSTSPMPKPGDFIEVSSGGGKTANTFTRILPANCGWRGLVLKRQEVECD